MRSSDDDIPEDEIDAAEAAVTKKREKREHHRQRRNKAAMEGHHLPSIPELLVPSAFWMGSNLFTDAKAWAERILPRINKTSEISAAVATMLEALTCEPQLGDFEAAIEEFAEARLASEKVRMSSDADRYRGPDAHACELRLHFYAATLGSPKSCVVIAQHAVELAKATNHPNESTIYLEAAVGWLSVSKDAREVRVFKGDLSRWDDTRHKSDNEGSHLMDAYVRHKTGEVHETLQDRINRTKKKAEEFLAEGSKKNGFHRNEIIENDEVVTPLEPGAVVIQEIGSPGTHEGKKIVEAYKSVVGLRLPLPPLPNLVDVRRNLAEEFPHATQVIDSIIRDLGNRDHVKLKPTIFVGKPGCGKTTFAARLLTELGVGHQIYPCGGVSDSSFAATARMWSTGNPSLPVNLVARYRTAAPGIILDEVNRAGTSRHNGSLVDCLLSMIEPVSACRYLDSYLQAEVDLTGVVWLATANDLETLPPALRDRFRIIPFPSPTIEHMPVLANLALQRAVEDQGYASCFEPRLDGIELEALAAVWPKSGSLRGLRKLVEAVLAARDVNAVGNA